VALPVEELLRRRHELYLRMGVVAEEEAPEAS
jgi:hypothetical protein